MSQRPETSVPLERPVYGLAPASVTSGDVAVGSFGPRIPRTSVWYGMVHTD